MAGDNDIFKIKHNNLLPGKGSILIAEPFLQDAYFQRAVVLLVDHGLNGSMGFVLNKKTDLVINDFFPDLEKLSDIPIYLGGPIRFSRLFFIHTLGEELIPGSTKITEGLYFDGNFEAIKQYIIHENSVAGKVKFFLGYSGWTKDQLGCEIEEDAWIVSRSLSSHIMSAKDESFWRHSLEVLGKKYKTWINFPKDPYMN
jgi:putative transcriptional regulator